MKLINQYQRIYKENIEKEKSELGRRPDWLKVRLPTGNNYKDVLSLMRRAKLHTVCEEAKCPNLGECWNNRTATFMILGDTCTRSCGFCNVKVGFPNKLDLEEPIRVAEAVEELELKHVVITSVNRDELKDGGASVFSETVRSIREKVPDCTIEILIPDFKGSEESFQMIMKNPPDILNHNLETIKRLYPVVRPQAKYERSLELIKWFKDNGLRTKSGIMVGIGEKPDEVINLLYDLIGNGCDILTIGQYLQPTKNHLPVDRYVLPEEFVMYKQKGLEIGFKAVESAPLVRSSYHADKHAKLI
jgi:lipoyl synthase